MAEKLEDLLVKGGLIVGALYVISKFVRGESCQEGEVKTKTCPDDSIIAVERCVDGKWVSTGLECPQIGPIEIIDDFSVPRWTARKGRNTFVIENGVGRYDELAARGDGIILDFLEVVNWADVMEVRVVTAGTPNTGWAINIFDDKGGRMRQGYGISSGDFEEAIIPLPTMVVVTPIDLTRVKRLQIQGGQIASYYFRSVSIVHAPPLETM